MAANNQKQLNTTIRTLIIGDNGVGKKTFITRHNTADFKAKSIVDGTKISFQTNKGLLTFELFVRNTKDNIDIGLFDGVFDGVIGMFDLTNKDSMHSLVGVFKDIKKSNIVVCGTKSDKIRQRQVQPNHIQTHILRPILKPLEGMYFDISSKSIYNYEKPFLFLARRHFKGEKVVFSTFS